MTPKPLIAILGAGPVGLEAALAAAEGGHPFTLFEAADRVAGNIRSWGHVRLFSPWSLNVSARARQRLQASGAAPSDGPECPTGNELVADFLEPLARLPEIAPHLRLGTRVVEISRQGLLKHEAIGGSKRAEQPFRLLLEDRYGERIETADIVLDCTGTWEHPNTTGDGGIAAPGERALGSAIRRTIPDFDREWPEWADREILVVGAGHSAQTALRELAERTATAPGTRISWALRNPQPAFHSDPDDPLPERAALAAAAGRLLDGGSPAVEVVPGVVVDSLARDGDRVVVTLRHTDGTSVRRQFDRVLSLTGSVGDHRLYRQLQVHECYATSGPMKLAAALLGESSTDCLAQTSHGSDTLRNPEPRFFILGSKSYGRNTSFLLRVGAQQVDEVFALLEEEAAAPVEA